MLRLGWGFDNIFLKDLLHLATFGYEIVVRRRIPWRAHQDGAKTFQAVVYMCSMTTLSSNDMVETL